MPVDHSIYFQQQVPDIAGGLERGLRMSDMYQQRKINDKAYAEDQAISESAKRNVVAGPDGQMTLDKKGYLSDLAKINPMKAIETDRAFKSQAVEDENKQLENHAKKATVFSQLLGSATDQNSYAGARAQAIQMGLADSKTLPEQYDPNYVKSVQMRVLSIKDRLDQGWKQKEFGLKERELDIKKKDAEAKRMNGEGLPIDKKKVVEGLATQNANKTSIKNQIDAVLSTWDKLSDDQKVSSGRQLLKTLNSTEGKDAIGAEEASRLGSRLEFAMGNFGNSNPMQFGRDLKGFKEQAKNTSAAIGTGIQSNQDVIDKNLGRPQTMLWEGVTYKQVGDHWVAQ